MSTRPDDLMEALIDRGASPRFAFVVLSAIQTIPRMLDKASRILDAQRSRGLATEGRFAARARAIVPLLGPLVIGSLIDVRERSLALEARAFGSSHQRTAYREVPIGDVDRRLIAIGMLLFAALPLVIAGRLAGLIR
jgi:energy-coupling factor transport system permease protein